MRLNFNPRLREGGDQEQHLSSITLSISIHASAKEATDFEYFVGDAIEFQSTPPRRRRPGTTLIINNVEHFNPRLREGGDFHPFPFPHPQKIFQSTPPRRRRRWRYSVKKHKGNFNPRLREGGDWYAAYSLAYRLISIHASAKEATQFTISPAGVL